LASFSTVIEYLPGVARPLALATMALPEELAL
jgi:hypothetical protein